LQAFHGQHCETVASGCLLKNLGIELSEPMLFGLGEGLSFIFLNLASLPLPFLGGRVKPFILTEALCKNLQLQLHESQTSSRNRSWRLLESQLAHGTPVGLQLDCFHLDYFTQRVHFAGHCLAALGIDEKTVTVVDTKQQGGLLRIDRSSLEAARFEKGPMSARARSWTITKGEQKPHLGNAVRTAIKNNASSYLAPPFKGASYQGISKLASRNRRIPVSKFLS